MIGERVVYTRQTRIAAIRPDGVLLVNPATFPRLPYAAKLFILAHEFAHAHGVKDEIAADIFAAEWLLEMGFSARDIALAQAMTLRNDPAGDNNVRIASLQSYLERQQEEIT